MEVTLALAVAGVLAMVALAVAVLEVPMRGLVAVVLVTAAFLIILILLLGAAVVVEEGVGAVEMVAGVAAGVVLAAVATLVDRPVITRMDRPARKATPEAATIPVQIPATGVAHPERTSKMPPPRGRPNTVTGPGEGGTP